MYLSLGSGVHSKVKTNLLVTQRISKDTSLNCLRMLLTMFEITLKLPLKSVPK